MDWKLTGATRVRQTWRSRIVIQVEEQNTFHQHRFRWRDATLNDLQDLAPSIQVSVPSLKLVG